MILKVRGLKIIKSARIANMEKDLEQQIKKEFGARLRSIRIQKNFSQEQLAFACGLDRTYIGGVERGERNISLVNTYKIAAALGISAKELF